MLQAIFYVALIVAALRNEDRAAPHEVFEVFVVAKIVGTSWENLEITRNMEVFMDKS